MSTKKPTIFLASDSTVQSYEETYSPQTGWGQVLIHYFKGGNSYKESSCDNCPYPQARLYESKSVIIENRAIGGRSSRSFIEEGKFNSLLEVILPGDFLFVQFGHNDSTIDRPNRYVAPNDFPTYLQRYIDACKKRQVTCVLITPVARRNCEDSGEFSISFIPYRDAMLQISKEQHIPLLDLGKYSTALCKSYGASESKSLFLWIEPGQYPTGAYADGVCDNTHLQKKGALVFANLVAALIAHYDTDNQLDELKAIIEPASIMPLKDLELLV